MEITVTKLTDVTLLQKANSFTTGKDSAMTLETAYRHQHSPIRTQLFWVECREIPLFVASQLVRSHVGVQYFQRSKRADRGGDDFIKALEQQSMLTLDACERIAADGDLLCNGKTPDKEATTQSLKNALAHLRTFPIRFDRYAKTDLAFICNAEALMNIAHKRLCGKASHETRRLVEFIKEEVAKVDEALARHMVPQCVYRAGLCSEPQSCKWIYTEDGADALTEYTELFNTKK